MDRKFRTPLRQLLLTLASLLGAVTLAHAAEPSFKPVFDRAPRDLVPATILHSEGRKVFLENIVALPGGDFAVTSLFDGRILRVRPDGRTRVLATVPGHASGIERSGDDLIVGGWAGDERRLLWRVSIASGQVEEFVHLAQAAMPNGITRLAPGVMLVADSVKGVIWRVDLATRRVTMWSDSALLAGFDPAVTPAIPAVNGLKRHGGWLYASNMSLNHFVRIQIRPDRSAGRAEVYASDVFGDDFVVDRRGRIYTTTHVHDSVVRIDTDRSTTVIGQRAEGLQGATALAFASAREDALVVVTNGGVYVPPTSGAEDAKIVRLTLPRGRATSRP
jgi:sugar lactone lactonase YvrE